MFKIIGIIILLFMSTMTGWLMADNLKMRLISLRKLINMLESIRLMIRYEALEISEIIQRLRDDEAYKELIFLQPLGEGIAGLIAGDEITYAEVWKNALENNIGAFGKEDISLIISVGSKLGTCDCDGQLSAVSLAVEQAKKLLASADEQYKAKGRLYRAIGAIAGAVIAVILI